MSATPMTPRGGVAVVAGLEASAGESAHTVPPRKMIAQPPSGGRKPPAAGGASTDRAVPAAAPRLGAGRGSFTAREPGVKLGLKLPAHSGEFSDAEQTRKESILKASEGEKAKECEDLMVKMKSLQQELKLASNKAAETVPALALNVQEISQLKEDLEAKLNKEKEDLQAKLMKEREDLKAQLMKEKEDLEAKLMKEKEDLEAKLVKQKEDSEAELMKQKEDLKAQLMKQKEDSEAELMKQKEDLEAKHKKDINKENAKLAKKKILLRQQTENISALNAQVSALKKKLSAEKQKETLVIEKDSKVAKVAQSGAAADDHLKSARIFSDAVRLTLKELEKASLSAYFAFLQHPDIQSYLKEKEKPEYRPRNL